MARCTLPNGAHLWLYTKSLDAAISQVPAPYFFGCHHGQRFQRKPQNTNKTQLLSSFLIVDWRKKLNNFGTCNGPFTHIIDATSYVQMWNLTIWAEKLSYILSYQTWSTDKIRKVINHEQSPRKPVGHIGPYCMFHLNCTPGPLKSGIALSFLWVYCRADQKIRSLTCGIVWGWGHQELCFIIDYLTKSTIT